jgi:radical SAM/Cys-rich protein
MNAFFNALDQSGISRQDSCLKRTQLTTLQINMGNLCNQSCAHCHVGASPEGNNIMSKGIIDAILKFLANNKGLILDITGGAPELNPHFDYLIEQANILVREIIVRSNLSVIFEPGKEYLPEFFKKYKIHLICSLPCYGKDNVDAQRGAGVFTKSIKALQKLNKLGYAKKAELALDLVYNPSGAFLPQQQAVLQKAYSEQLKENYNIDFNRLVTITNVPINRFKEYLNSRGEYNSYIDLLKQNFNPGVVCEIMCRKFLSIGYDGKVYDCDFNQSLGWMIKDTSTNPLTISNLNPDQLKNRNIQVGEHCLSCTAGYGSSCQGALSEIKE